MGLTAFLLIYLLGGVSFIPLVIVAVLAHAHYTLPHRPDLDPPSASDNGQDDLVQPGDDTDALQAAQQQQQQKKLPSRAHHESDVAAGYFAVCREYAPMGINAKPIERSTPVGSATVAAPSQSVYQTMYRSLFDRKQPTAGPLDNKNAPSQRPRKAGNVFYVVLRHGHLMLFDDDEQLEVRHVVSLAHHDVTIFSGDGDLPTPEGELYIKKNAICLSRRADGPDLAAASDAQLSKPFFLFSENCSAKEDFYFSLLRNQEQSFGGEDGPEAPTPRQFKVEHVISLVQKLHSSEDHLQTRWLNAIIGRLFLGVYGTKDLENAIREKLTKKISRVKRPSFLSNISIRGIETGDSAPYITNPRLKDLTVEGECGVEADVKYTGNFRIEVAATARIDLGTRFKAREVNLVLAVVLRKLEGHVLFKIKPPPSNRIWFSFQTMPKMETTVEPIISSRQITYTVILRQIEARIKEVVAETLVLPFWDDIPFFNTEHKRWRGGIFEGDDAVVSEGDLETLNAQMGDVDETEESAAASAVPAQDFSFVEKSHSMPVLERSSTTHTGLFGRRINGKSGIQTSNPKAARSCSTSVETKATSLSTSAGTKAMSSSTSLETSLETKASAAPSPLPRTKRSNPPTAPASPTVETDENNADVFKPSSSPPNESPAVQAVMATLSAKAAAGSAPVPDNASQSSLTSKLKLKKSSGSTRSTSSKEISDSDREKGLEPPLRPDRRHTVSSSGSGKTDEDMSSAASIKGSIRNQTGTLTRNFFLRHKVSHESLVGREGGGANGGSNASSPGHAPIDSPKRNALLTVTNAAATAKRWGLNALQRGGAGAGAGAGGNNGEGNSPGGRLGDGDEEEPLDLNKPMGGGQPLPPPGTPLPMPERKGKVTVVPRRRPAAPLAHPHQVPNAGGDGADGAEDASSSSGQQQQRRLGRKSLPVASLSKRRQMRQLDSPMGSDRVLVVEAPAADSEPTTPNTGDGDSGYMHRHPWASGGGAGGDEEDDGGPRTGGAGSAYAADDDDDDAAGYDDEEGVSAWMDNDYDTAHPPAVAVVGGDKAGHESARPPVVVSDQDAK
ncbi:hypothetical protein RB595_005058 [Gaeumannomyces hyphopodioides]